MDITIVGLDLAKNDFQVHGINTAGDVVARRRLRRSRVHTFFAGLEPLPDWHGGLWHGSFLGTGTDGAWS